MPQAIWVCELQQAKVKFKLIYLIIGEGSKHQLLIDICGRQTDGIQEKSAKHAAFKYLYLEGCKKCNCFSFWLNISFIIIYF